MSENGADSVAESAEKPPSIKSQRVASQGTSQSAGQSTDESKGRTFPCEGCGADLIFHIGQQQLKCPYCNFEKEIVLADDAKIAEQDFRAILSRMQELREQRQHDHADNDDPEKDEPVNQQELRCDSCGGTVVFLGTLTSSECPYCASPIQLDSAHKAKHRIAVDAVLPFQIPRETARRNLSAWVRSRWFAPNDFLKRGIDGKFNGVYLPFWTFDTLTSNHYQGERGEYYYEKVSNRKAKVRRTRWYPASGFFQRFFDDVLVPASVGLPRKLLLSLEPWPLTRCLPFNQEALAGYLARTYEVELDQGFIEAKQRIDAAIRIEVVERIGGDDQRVHSIKTNYDALTFKHLLLPTWLMAYRFQDKPFQVVINAASGEVQGERPYSWIKITLALLASLTAATVAYLVVRS